MVTKNKSKAIVRGGQTLLDDQEKRKSDGGKGKWVNINAGESVDIVPLTGIDGILSIRQHHITLAKKAEDGRQAIVIPALAPADVEYPERYDPGFHIQKNLDKYPAVSEATTSWKSFLSCLVKGEKEERVYSFGQSILKALASYDSVIDGIEGKVFRITRTGKGKLDTRYEVIFTGKSVTISEPETDLVEVLGELEKDKQLEMLKKYGINIKVKLLDLDEDEDDEEEVDDDIEDEEDDTDEDEDDEVDDDTDEESDDDDEKDEDEDKKEEDKSDFSKGMTSVEEKEEEKPVEKAKKKAKVKA